MLPTLANLQHSLASGAVTSVKLTQQALARAQDSAGQGKQVFTRLYPERALAAAQASDVLRHSGVVRSALEGLPISIKDLFDVAGEPTLSGSKVLHDAPPATQTAAAIRRLQEAGAIVTGKTNMVEFAFSGLGINPHYGTPHSSWDGEAKRIPGGSSSGAGVAVAEGFSTVSIGSDTGGSVRIPSAFCGLTGFKPTARRVPTQGALPLSTTLDSLGPLAASVACCAAVDAVLSGEGIPGSAREPVAMRGTLTPLAASGLRLAVPANLVLDDADDTVRTTFARALQVLKDAGARIETIEIPEFSELASINAKGGFTGAEAWALHRERLATRADEYDPRVASRIIRCQAMTAADYIDLIAIRARWIASIEQRLRGRDALLMPTVPIVAPRISELQASDDAYFAANRLILRNPTLINFLDGCALSLPCHTEGDAPVGLMVAGCAMQDHHVLNVGVTIEAMLHDLRTGNPGA
ncbi:MAG TPA: amidase [Castellaniella sp.]|uniref:amidase n=1 Tax=Castellaniella sp. TaxID=1955812 RepID=UPI002F1C9D73